MDAHENSTAHRAQHLVPFSSIGSVDQEYLKRYKGLTPSAIGTTDTSATVTAHGLGDERESDAKLVGKPKVDGEPWNGYELTNDRSPSRRGSRLGVFPRRKGGNFHGSKPRLFANATKVFEVQWTITATPTHMDDDDDDDDDHNASTYDSVFDHLLDLNIESEDPVMPKPPDAENTTYSKHLFVVVKRHNDIDDGFICVY